MNRLRILLVGAALITGGSALASAQVLQHDVAYRERDRDRDHDRNRDRDRGSYRNNDRDRGMIADLTGTTTETTADLNTGRRYRDDRRFRDRDRDRRYDGRYDYDRGYAAANRRWDGPALAVLGWPEVGLLRIDVSSF